MFVFQCRATGASGIKARGMRLLATDDDLKSFLLEKFSKHVNCLHIRVLQTALEARAFDEFIDYLDGHCRVTILFAGVLAPEAKLVPTNAIFDMFQDKEVILQCFRNLVATKARENHERFNSR